MINGVGRGHRCCAALETWVANWETSRLLLEAEDFVSSALHRMYQYPAMRWVSLLGDCCVESVFKSCCRFIACHLWLKTLLWYWFWMFHVFWPLSKILDSSLVMLDAQVAPTLLTVRPLLNSMNLLMLDMQTTSKIWNSNLTNRRKCWIKKNNYTNDGDQISSSCFA